MTNNWCKGYSRKAPHTLEKPKVMSNFGVKCNLIVKTKKFKTMGILTSLKNLRPLKGAFLVALLAFMPNLFIHAQVQVPTPDPCVPDCPNSQWGPKTTVTLDDWTYQGMQVDCEVKVTFVKRTACPSNFKDLQILKVEVVNGGGCPFAIENQSAAIEALHRKLIVEDKAGFGLPANGNCNSNWRVSQGSCWKFVNIEGGNTFFVPCEPIDACCLTRYEVCADPCGNLSIEKQNTIRSGDCDDKEGFDLVCP